MCSVRVLVRKGLLFGVVASHCGVIHCDSSASVGVSSLYYVGGKNVLKATSCSCSLLTPVN